MATQKSGKNTDTATQTNSADATTGAPAPRKKVLASATAGHTHVARHTIQYFDPEKNAVIEVKAGNTFAAPDDVIASLSRNDSIREATDDDLERNNVAQQNAVERRAGPVGYADNTAIDTAVYPGGVTNPNDIPANAGDNTGPEGQAGTDAALAGAPVTSNTTTR